MRRDPGPTWLIWWLAWALVGFWPTLLPVPAVWKWAGVAAWWLVIGGSLLLLARWKAAADRRKAANPPSFEESVASWDRSRRRMDERSRKAK